jgi:hypothetical protein
VIEGESEVCEAPPDSDAQAVSVIAASATKVETLRTRERLKGEKFKINPLIGVRRVCIHGD